MAAVAFLHYSVGTASRAVVDASARMNSSGSRLGRLRDVFDIYTIIFLALAVFIFLRLRSVLGQRTGRERPPYDPYSAREAARTSTNDNVVTLPPRPSDAAPQPAADAEPVDRWKGIAEPGSAAAVGLDAVLAQDASFDAKHFLTGARAAYEMTVTGHAQGDRRS